MDLGGAVATTADQQQIRWAFASGCCAKAVSRPRFPEAEECGDGRRKSMQELMPSA